MRHYTTHTHWYWVLALRATQDVSIFSHCQPSITVPQQYGGLSSFGTIVGTPRRISAKLTDILVFYHCHDIN
ncbi:MAG: hypothetical protein RML40_03805 [Bacteroidota bacterium]|nr:hypothetical protein [Candidatus Kapabacteria bacterium]MDW8219636.1 hypothetical protein [Bacteroidota bacterium]